MPLSQDEASSKVSAMGLMPTMWLKPADPLRMQEGYASQRKSAGFSFGKVIKPEELTTFTRQLATLLQAGLPLLRALEVMTRQEQ